MIDIDDFKTVNDTMGHAMGDLALINLVKILKENFRKDDIVGRLGGDEFIVFMTDTEFAADAEAKGAEILDVLGGLQGGTAFYHQCWCCGLSCSRTGLRKPVSVCGPCNVCFKENRQEPYPC